MSQMSQSYQFRPVEMRNEAWRLLWREKWLSRLIFIIVAFNFIRYVAVNAATSLLASANLATERLMEAKSNAELFEALHDPALLRDFGLVTALALFVAAVIDAMASYGLARVQLAAVRGDGADGWRRTGFSGLRDPFGMFALAFLRGLFVWWPFVFIAAPALCADAGAAMSGGIPLLGLAALVPCAAISAVSFYRYRQVWFLKAAHCDWSALKCLRESARMMAGAKRRCFWLDCAFWRPVTLMILTAFATCLAALLGLSPVALMLVLLLTVQSLCLQAHISLAQALFHLELQKAGDRGDEDRGHQG